MLIKPDSKIILMGDSVTDADRVRPCGEGIADGFGVGYANMVDVMLNADYPELNVRCVNMGVSGNTTQSLVERWDDDVTSMKPDFVTLMIGVNDVWRQFDSPMRPDWAVFPKEYEKNLNVIADKTTVPMLWITPFFIEPNRQDLMRKRMDEYRGIFKSVAKERGYNVVDVQEIFDEYLQKRYSAYLSWDRVHPGRIGGYLIAKAVVKALIGRSL